MTALISPTLLRAAAGAMLITAGAAFAQTAPATPPAAAATPGHPAGHDSVLEHRHGAHHGGPEGMRRGMGMEMGMGMGNGMEFLRGVRLSDAQRDQVFTLMHQQAPAMRDKAKALGKTRQELRALALSPQFDEARAKALSDGLAAGLADMAMTRARTANAVWQLLTPEQKSQVEARRARADAGEHGHRHLALR
ncbi:MAG: Spy/CpxP family protein refolding chaperone [Betaproteobacteria bacterium]|nr:Spy/CpxP family protein refolding chaperone [Betaproteobacteria bacterium]